ncbi:MULTISPECIES: hypothetical protein [Pedobacter]|uniref:DUF3299 domain-containing protein n=1 Tax=Pedobacter zeae TaxID=1737356 RepID=A0A7W6P6E9_9SPHI|nr:hypothetical protein [Pedobacter zeae]MBB4107859.1 hypothetical protein [Pedobacter zeae]GGG96583.1 hypothetical protein GCM10007422_07990 [Pedobacter zeae]
MKTLYFILLLLFGNVAFSQTQKHNPNDQLRSLNWDIIGSVKFELTEKNELFPLFTESIKRFDNREFDLKGYLIPIKSGQKQQKFLLATLPINQCYFCGQNGVPVMIMIEMESPAAYSEKPIHVKGILKLEQKDASYAPPITIKNAKLIN